MMKMFNTKQPQPGLIDKNRLATIVRDLQRVVQDQRLATAINIYYTMLDKTLQNGMLQTTDGWSLFIEKIVPDIKIMQDGVPVIGAVLTVSFMSDFQNNPLPVFTITAWNFFDPDAPFRSLSEACYNIKVNIVPDTKLPDLKMLMTRYSEKIEDTLKEIWAENIMVPLKSTIETADDEIELPRQPQQQTHSRAPSYSPASPSFPVKPVQNVVTSPVLSAFNGIEMPTLPGSSSKKKMGLDPSLSPVDSGVIMAGKQVEQSPLERDDGRENDADMDIDFDIAARMPDLSSSDDDVNVPPMSRDMLKHK